MAVEFELDGVAVRVVDESASLLEALRGELRVRSVKDGCSPQGQCGCCTVLVDGAPRVACVTPVRRVRGRRVTTLEGLDESTRGLWAKAFCACGASQCGFCTPGIVLRLEALRRAGSVRDLGAVERALSAHLCRCTGWRTILEAWELACGSTADVASGPRDLELPPRDAKGAEARALIEGGVSQRVGPEVVLGQGGFASDTAPPDCLIAVPDQHGEWHVAETLAEARRAVGKVQGRRSTAPVEPPLSLPEGRWDLALRTSWVEPAYLEPDASWCEPGGEPWSPVANGGAFGGKSTSPLPAVARRLADEYGKPVLALWWREDVTRHGPKRPPVAIGVDSRGHGVCRVVRTPGIAERIRAVDEDLVVEEVEVPGPPTSADIRAAGWAEAAVVTSVVRGTPGRVRDPWGGEAEATVEEGKVFVRVRCGDPLDLVTLRSYCIGAAHMAIGWVTSEGLAVGPDGEVQDLTIRSFGVLKASETPPIEVEVDESGGEPVRASDAVFAAVASAVWYSQGCPVDWPTRTRVREAAGRC
ncbi:MAG: hypothetical protein KatS3mg008_1514 [Acidimicrobiales bacterium]|nr:MAG: hypothetical protein KatS3mg008_1514 [Acidimicrobiales bacterium]